MLSRGIGTSKGRFSDVCKELEGVRERRSIDRSVVDVPKIEDENKNKNKGNLQTLYTLPEALAKFNQQFSHRQPLSTH